MAGRAMLVALFAWQILPRSAGAAEGPTCVDVRIGSERSFACLNAQIAKVIPQRRFTAGSDLPVPSGIPAPAAGTYNTAATSEQMGTAFGKSTQPQRPPVQAYPVPLRPAR